MPGPTQKVTITCSAEDLNAKLSKAQKELGLTHDEYGRLINKQGEFVGGLSQARVRMGDYIDAQGRMRDAQGHFLDGLSATELKLRMYKDELGNVYTAEGELVRQSEEAARAQEELSTAGQRGMQSLMSGAEGAARMASNLSLMIGVLGGGNEGLNKFGQNVVIATQSFSQFALAMQTLPKFVQGFKLLTAATQGQTAAQVFLNAVSGNWVTLIAGGLAAGTLAYKTLSDSTKEAAEKTAEAVKQVDALTVAYKRLGQARGEGGAIGAGAVAAGVSEIDLLEEHQKRVNDLSKAYDSAAKAYGQADKALREYESTTGSVEKKMDQSMFWRFLQWGGGKVGNAFGGNFETETEGHKANREADDANTARGEAEAALKEASDEYARAVQNMISKDMPRDEMKELKDRAAEYAKALEIQNLNEEARATIQAALDENQRKQNELIERQNEEKQRAVKEAEEAEERRAAEAARKVAEAQNALESTGFGRYARQTDEELENFNKTIESWKANAETAGVSTDELNAAIQNYTDEFNARRNEKGIADLGLDQYLKEPEQTPLEKYNEVFEKVREAEEKFGLDKERANQILLNAEQEYADALRNQAEEEQRKKESRLNELGITGLREKRKTEEDKLIEQQTKIAQAVEEGLISTREANDLNNDLMKEYWEKFVGEEGGAGTGEPEQKAEKVGGANSSMTVGSQSLYQALIAQRDDPYKSEVKQRMTELGKTQENTYTKIESLEEAVTGYIERLREML